MEDAVNLFLLCVSFKVKHWYFNLCIEVAGLAGKTNRKKSLCKSRNPRLNLQLLYLWGKSFKLLFPERLWDNLISSVAIIPWRCLSHNHIGRLQIFHPSSLVHNKDVSIFLLLQLFILKRFFLCSNRLTEASILLFTLGVYGILILLHFHWNGN